MTDENQDTREHVLGTGTHPEAGIPDDLSSNAVLPPELLHTELPQEGNDEAPASDESSPADDAAAEH